jgi:hypothetical protein
MLAKRKEGNISSTEGKKIELYLYKFGASAEEECPPNIQTFPTTNQTAKKQSNAILKWSNRALILQMARDFYFNINARCTSKQK